MDDEVVDALDYQVLAAKTFLRARQDYIHLQHPNYRRRKYLREAFLTATDMFWDPEYRMACFTNEYGDDMDIEEFVRLVSDRERVDMPALQQHLVEESLSYWDEKEMQTLEIPNSIVIEGHVYYVEQLDEPDYIFDLETKRIYLDKNQDDSENQERFVEAVMELTFHHQEVRLSGAARKKLAKAWFRTLRINNCFTGVS